MSAPMPPDERQAADDVVAISDLSYTLGQWQVMAEALARYLRSGFQTGEEKRHLLAAFDELRARTDG